MGVGVLGSILFHSLVVVSGGVLSTISSEPTCTGEFDRCKGKHCHVGLVAGSWVGQAKAVVYHLRVEYAVSYHKAHVNPTSSCIVMGT